MSCPAFACASAAPVISNLLPLPVMKAACTSTLFLAAQASTCFCMMSLPLGTQWSQKPTASLPAAPAVRIWTSGNAVAAAESCKALRRVIRLGLRMAYTPWPAGVVPGRFLFQDVRGSDPRSGHQRQRVPLAGLWDLPHECIGIIAEIGGRGV